MLCHRGRVRTEVGQRGQLEGHARRECGPGEVVDPDHEVFLGSIEFLPPLDHFKGQLMQVITLL